MKRWLVPSRQRMVKGVGVSKAPILPTWLLSPQSFSGNACMHSTFDLLSARSCTCLDVVIVVFFLGVFTVPFSLALRPRRSLHCSLSACCCDEAALVLQNTTNNASCLTWSFLLTLSLLCWARVLFSCSCGVRTQMIAAYTGARIKAYSLLLWSCQIRCCSICLLVVREYRPQAAGVLLTSHSIRIEINQSHSQTPDNCNFLNQFYLTSNPPRAQSYETYL